MNIFCSWLSGLLFRLFFHVAGEWSFGEQLLRWGRGGPDFTVGLSYEGSLHLGASGSGKTSGGLRLQAVAMAQAGYGMLCQTVKATSPSDVEFFVGIAKDAGRERSVVLVGPTHHLGINILRYEMTASRLDGSLGDMAANVATLFSFAAELALPNRGKQGDHIWRLAVESLVRHAVTVVYSATGDLHLDDIVSVVKTTPQSATQVTDAAWCRESTCIKMLGLAATRRPTDRNLELARSYFLSELPGFPPDTRNSVMFTFGSGCADLFQREPLRSMFFADTDYTPSIILDGAILVVDCPVLEYREVGKIANGLLRICTQRVLERRAKHTLIVSLRSRAARIWRIIVRPLQKSA